MNFLKKIAKLFTNKIFVTWFTVGVSVIVMASLTLGIMLPSYTSWRSYYDASIADREYKKYLQTLPFECTGITAELNDNTVYYANGKANPTTSDFTVIASYTEKGVASEKILLDNEFTVSVGADFARNGGDVTIKYVFTPDAPVDEDGNAQEVTPVTFTAAVSCALETVVPVAIARHGSPFRSYYSNEMPFDGDGLNAAVTFNDGSVEIVGNDEFTYSDELLTLETESVNVKWSRGGAEFDFDCPVTVVDKSEYADGNIIAISSAGAYYLNPGDDTASAKPPIRATYESGNRLLLAENKYTVRGNTAKASFTKKCILSVFLANDPSIFTRTSAIVKSGVRAETATLTLADKVEINESSWVDGEIVTSEETSTVVSPRNGSQIRFGFACDAISKPDMSVRVALKPTVVREPAEGDEQIQAQSDELVSVSLASVMTLQVNGATVKLPDNLVITQKAGEEDKYVFYDFVFPTPVLRNANNDIRFVFRGENASKIVVDRINLEAAYKGNFFASTEQYFTYNAEQNINAEYNFTVVKPFGTVANKVYGHSICSDGTYLYMVGQGGSGASRTCQVSKYDPKINTEVAVSSGLKTGSVSEAYAGITYYDGKIIVYYTDGTKMYAEAGDAFTDGVQFREYHGYHFEGLINEPVMSDDGETVVTAPTKLKDVYYNTAEGKFAVYFDNSLRIFNKDMTLYKEVKGFVSGATRIAGSADYIYASYTKNGDYSPRIRVYDWEGNPVGDKEMTISVPQDFLTANGVTNFSNTNVQAVAVINGDFYVTILKFNPGDSSAFIKISMPEIDELLTPELSFNEYMKECNAAGISPKFTAAPTNTAIDNDGSLDKTSGYAMGGASDGRYLYVANNRNSNSAFVVSKIDLETNACIASSTAVVVNEAVNASDNSRLFIKDGVLYAVAGDVYSIPLDEFNTACDIPKDEAMTALLSDNGNRVLKSAYWNATQRRYIVLENGVGTTNPGGDVYILDEFGAFIGMVNPFMSGCKVADVAGNDDYFLVMYNANALTLKFDMYRYNGEKAYSVSVPGISVNGSNFNLQSLYFHGDELHCGVLSWSSGYNTFHDWTVTPDLSPLSITDNGKYLKACISSGVTPVYTAKPTVGTIGLISGVNGTYSKGGASDGEYLYIAQGDSSTTVAKVNLSTYTVVATSAAMPAGGDKGRLFIKDGVLYCTLINVYSIKLSDFAAGCTLTHDTEMQALLSQNGKYSVISAYYNAEADKYAVLASDANYYVLNGDGSVAVPAMTRSISGMAIASVCGDDNYFYVSRKADGQVYLPIHVYTWDGKYVRDLAIVGIDVGTISYNIQAVYEVNGTLHVAVCTWGGTSGFKDWTLEYFIGALD